MRKPTTIVRAATIALLGLTVAACYTSPAVAGSDADPVLSWPGDPATTMAVSWFSRTPEPFVELRHPHGGEETIPGDRNGAISTVIIEDLEPDTAYSYRVAGDSEWHGFRTAAREFDSISFAVIGDLQPFNAETERTTRLVMNRVAELDPAFVVQIGDFAELGGGARSNRLALSVFSDVASSRAAVAASGNHDHYLTIAAGTFRSIFPAATAPGSRNGAGAWYSVTIGHLHFAVLDTEMKGQRFDAQIEWLAADLAAATAAGAEWVFLVMHRPMLVSAGGHANERWGQAIFPLFAQHDVDAVFWGHDHVFEHYEYTYGKDGRVFDVDDSPALDSTHIYTVPPGGARVDALYPGFFTHSPYTERWPFVSRETCEAAELVFEQRPWNPEIAMHELPGIRFQDPERYRRAASYYYWPFDSAEDEAAGIYSNDTRIRYTDNAEFFGYTYGETSIGYLWVEIDGESCTISSHYIDGEPGEHGTLMTTPSGLPLRWELQ